MEQDCNLTTRSISRANSKHIWYQHQCEECSLNWLSPIAGTEGFECAKVHQGRMSAKCVHVGEKRVDKEGNQVTVPCGCHDKNVVFDVHECKIHGRCLPKMDITSSKLEIWRKHKPESDLYQSCRLCPDYEESNG